jgi:hypothetical protein
MDSANGPICANDESLGYAQDAQFQRKAPFRILAHSGERVTKIIQERHGRCRLILVGDADDFHAACLKRHQLRVLSAARRTPRRKDIDDIRAPSERIVRHHCAFVERRERIRGRGAPDTSLREGLALASARQQERTDDHDKRKRGEREKGQPAVHLALSFSSAFARLAQCLAR